VKQTSDFKKSSGRQQNFQVDVDMQKLRQLETASEEKQPMNTYDTQTNPTMQTAQQKYPKK